MTSASLCRTCVCIEHPVMLSGYSLFDHTCERCGRIHVDCALTTARKIVEVDVEVLGAVIAVLEGRQSPALSQSYLAKRLREAVER